MNRFVTALVVRLIILDRSESLHFAEQLSETGGWFLAAKYQSCENYCTSAGKICADRAGDRTIEQLVEEFEEAGLNCDFTNHFPTWEPTRGNNQRPSTVWPYLPVWSSTHTISNLHGWCYVGDSSRYDFVNADCAAIPAAPNTENQRLCYCKPAVEDIIPIAKDDPHCVNMGGEKFDIFETGNMTMVKVPRHTANAQFEVQVTIKRAGGAACAETFIEQVDITGSLVGKNMGIEFVPGRAGHPINISAIHQTNVTKLQGNTLVIAIGNVTIFLWQQHNSRYRVDYLSMTVTGLRKSFGDDVGGLLGYGKHASVAHRNEECRTLRKNRREPKHMIAVTDDNASGMISAALAN